MTITDEQGVKWFLQKTYEARYRYIAIDKDGRLFLYEHEPIKYENTWKCIDGDYDEIPDYLRELINPLVSWGDEEALDIGKYLGIVDWENVPVDAKVLVSHDGKSWKKRYFKRYAPKNDKHKYVCFDNGCTLWSGGDECYEVGWRYCKLAEIRVLEENGL